MDVQVDQAGYFLRYIHSGCFFTVIRVCACTCVRVYVCVCQLLILRVLEQSEENTELGG